VVENKKTLFVTEEGSFDVKLILRFLRGACDPFASIISI